MTVDEPVPRGTGDEPDASTVDQIFGAAADTVRAYAELLTDEAVLRGLIGPREAPRLWERHLLNSAVVARACARDARVVDIGSGAGFPGLPMVLSRPDLTMILVEPLARRASWLVDVVRRLGLQDRVSVLRCRAQELREVTADVVTSRAVAPLERLLPMSVPLCAEGGSVVAIKGDAAGQELAGVQARLAGWGYSTARVARFGEDVLARPTTAVVALRARRGGHPW